MDLWELYRDNHGTENDHPEIFPEDQLYIVFELGNAGQDLEAYNFDNGAQSFSAFLQVMLRLMIECMLLVLFCANSGKVLGRKYYRNFLQ